MGSVIQNINLGGAIKFIGKFHVVDGAISGFGARDIINSDYTFVLITYLYHAGQATNNCIYKYLILKQLLIDSALDGISIFDSEWSDDNYVLSLDRSNNTISHIRGTEVYIYGIA